MLFAIENEKQSRMSFLDVSIIREDKTFTASVYPKPTFSGIFTNFDRFLSPACEFDTVFTLFNRCFRICSS